MRPRRPVLVALGLLAALAAGGCVMIPAAGGEASPGTPESSPSQDRSDLRASNRFALTGRFSARHDGRRLTALFAHQTDGLNTLTEVFSPLGTVLARLQVDALGTTLALADGTVRRDASIGALLKEFTGLEVHDEALPFWLRGLPGNPAVTTTGGLFRESGWLIDVIEVSAESPHAPRRMRWRPQALPESEIVWLIDRWVFE